MIRLGATGIPHSRHNNTIESNTRFYLDLCHKAADAHVDILCLPEIMLQVGMPSTAADVARLAVTVPGKEVEPFQELAQATEMALCFSVWERERELIHNSAILIDKWGDIAGKYHKVHLALPSEPWQGITPGHDFPVYSLDDLVVGMNICMDTSASESMRVPARKGAEILLMPIMGDHRATPLWDGSGYIFDMKRWCMIHCVHAMDNQLYIVTGVNEGIGSGIFAPNGEVLACSDGTQPVVWADVDLNESIRPWSGCTARNMLWAERREPAYGILMAAPDPFQTIKSVSQVRA
jgi:predicted amidohydrolase